jgi:hypothetical protein
MDYLKNIHEKVKVNTSRSFIEKLVDDLILLNSGNVIKEIANRWKYGLSVDGGKIGRYASEEYALFKYEQNPLAGLGNVDLDLFGDLKEGLFLKRTSTNKFTILSSDEKYKKIGVKYGFEEFGLTEEQLYEFLGDLEYFAFETIVKKIYN